MPRRMIGGIAVGIAMAGFLGLMALGLMNKSPVTGRSGYTRVGGPAPEFTLPLLDGGEFALADHRGQPMVINFWASWCPPCRDEAPALERTWRSYKVKNVLFVGVDIQETEQDGRAYLREFDITYPNVLDKDGKVTVDYGVIGLPVTFFVNSEGIIGRRWVGAIKEKQLVTWIDEMIAGVAPSGDSEGQNPEGFFKLDQ